MATLRDVGEDGEGDLAREKGGDAVDIDVDVCTGADADEIGAIGTMGVIGLLNKEATNGGLGGLGGRLIYVLTFAFG